MVRTLVLVAVVADAAIADKARPPKRPSLVDAAAAIEALTAQVFRDPETPPDDKIVLGVLAPKVSYGGVTYYERAIETPTPDELACEKRFGAKGVVEGAARTAFVRCRGFWASANVLTETTWNHLPKNLAKFRPILQPLAANHLLIEGEFMGAIIYSTVYTVIADPDGKARIDGIYSYFAVP